MQKPQIAGYEILEQIAEGGMATVWKARQTSLDRLVALKVLNVGLIKGEADLERFRLEARAAAQLRHTGLCQIYDAGEVEGTAYYIMEYVAGFSVGQLLARKGDLPEKQALMIAYGVAQVLQAIWDKHQVIHCDIKPDNILIDQDGVIRITDLGVARIIGNMAQHVDAEYVVGTPNYISPEQAQGIDDLDCRTDIYGLGATLYHMLTGLMPFADKEGEQAMEGHRSGYIADPQKLNASVSNGAACLVEKLMVKDRSARYGYWADVIKDLDEVRAGRLPRGDLVARGQSTVSRTEERETAIAGELLAMKPKGVGVKSPAAGGGAVPGRRAPAAKSKSPGAAKPKVRRATAPVALSGDAVPTALPPPVPWPQTFFLLLLVGAAYAVAFLYLPRRAETDAPASTATETAASSVTAPRDVRGTIPEPTVAPQPQPPARPTMPPRAERVPEPTPPPVVRVPTPDVRAATDAVERPAPPAAQPASGEVWDHPSYVEAMRLLRAADADFQRFLAARDQALLHSIEPSCRQAIQLLESVRAEAPARAVVGERIRQAYQLINNARQSRVIQ